MENGKQRFMKAARPSARPNSRFPRVEQHLHRTGWSPIFSARGTYKDKADGCETQTSGAPLHAQCRELRDAMVTISAHEPRPGANVPFMMVRIRSMRRQAGAAVW